LMLNAVRSAAINERNAVDADETVLGAAKLGEGPPSIFCVTYDNL